MEEHLEPFDDDRRIPIPPSINSNLWEKGRSLGSGAHGHVYVGRHRRTKKLCAIKETRGLENRYAQSLHQEIKILQRLKHHNIVKYYGSKIVESQISIYMEYVEPGSLKKYIGSRGLQETLVRNFTKQILLGLVYLHGQRVVHRDIKPDNLLVDSKNNVKLADFGLAKHLAQSAGKHSVDGTIHYAAPELIQKEAHKSSGEAYAADIWSLGCVVIEMFTGINPWPNCANAVQVMFRVCLANKDPEIPKNLSFAGNDFLERCFMRDPAKRPSAAELLNHPFVNAQFDDGQHHEAANPIPSAIGSGKYEMVYTGRNRETRESCAINETLDDDDDSIPETTDFSIWEKGQIFEHDGYGALYVARNSENYVLEALLVSHKKACVFFIRDGESRELCAVKELKNIDNITSVESIKREIHILSQLEHPNILKYYGHRMDEGSCISLYMEFIQPGSLKKYILKQGVLPEPLIQNFTAQILNGLVYLQRKRLVHRDIKPDNILVDFVNIVKLGGFGLSEHRTESVGKHSQIGTICYAAPEVLGNEEYKSSREACAADVWSLGCVIIEMFSGEKPWPDLHPLQVIFNIHCKHQHPPIPEKLCEEGKDFLELCFTRTPTNRPSAAALLNHPFVKPRTFCW